MNLVKNKKQLFVSLGSEIDFERFFQYSKNERLGELRKPNDFIYFEIDNIYKAKELCQIFIKTYNLGGSNWIGGKVIDSDNNFIAKISYNGRIWDSDNWKIAKEITI